MEHIIQKTVYGPLETIERYGVLSTEYFNSDFIERIFNSVYEKNNYYDATQDMKRRNRICSDKRFRHFLEKPKNSLKHFEIFEDIVSSTGRRL